MENPHDKLFKETMNRKENAVSFFREYLPGHIVSNADWRSLSISKDSFIDEELKERFSDIVYTVRVKGKLMFIYILFEHQSYVDPFMALRMLGYMIKIWELYLKQNPDAKKLPAIVPIVFYHGRDRWKTDEQFISLIEEPGLLKNYIPEFEYILKDFSGYSDEEIKGSIMLRLFLSVIKNAVLPGFEEEFKRLVPLFVELSKKKTGMEYIETILKYIFNPTTTLNEFLINNIPGVPN